MKILIGADPEFFLKNPNSGAFVSGHGLIPGDKRNPFQVPHGAVQVDGTALEFNIDPAATADEFVLNTERVLGTLRDMVDPGYKFAFEPVADYDPEYFSGLPDQVKVLGCDPDFNAWTGARNDPPPMDLPMRTASGHIHIGWTNNADPFSANHIADCHTVVKQLDYFLGVNSLLWDSDNRRRSMYGLAGACRYKPYGVEYRTLSNRWLASPLLQRWIFAATQKAIDSLESGKIYHEIYGDSARTIIDKNIVDWPDHYQFEFDLPAPPKLAMVA